MPFRGSLAACGKWSVGTSVGAELSPLNPGLSDSESSCSPSPLKDPRSVGTRPDMNFYRLESYAQWKRVEAPLTPVFLSLKLRV